MLRSTARESVRPGRARGRALLASWAVAASACGEGAPTGPELVELEDGAYTVTLAGPVLVNPLATPTWMGHDVAVEFTKTGDDVVVTGSTMDLVVLGPPLSVASDGRAWTAQFSWSGHIDREHYWEVDLTATECLGARAVDADLGIGPGGVWTVELTSCALIRH